MVVLIPAVVPVSMSVVFAGLRGRLTARTAYNVGFAVYWVGWCAAVSLWILGPANGGAAADRGPAAVRR